MNDAVLLLAVDLTDPGIDSYPSRPHREVVVVTPRSLERVRGVRADHVFTTTSYLVELTPEEHARVAEAVIPVLDPWVLRHCRKCRANLGTDPEGAAPPSP